MSEFYKSESLLILLFLLLILWVGGPKAVELVERIIQVLSTPVTETIPSSPENTSTPVTETIPSSPENTSTPVTETIPSSPENTVEKYFQFIKEGETQSAWNMLPDSVQLSRLAGGEDGYTTWWKGLSNINFKIEPISRANDKSIVIVNLTYNNSDGTLMFDKNRFELSYDFQEGDWKIDNILNARQVSGSFVRIRSGSGQQYEVIGIVNSNDLVWLIEISQNPDSSGRRWYEVLYLNDNYEVQGWIRSDFIKRLSQESV
ncbi:hypothetical protein [Egbenema bharatensis]|uniref:hypothetical protein n=1 Tax=Egbenema bharatensis TaxID=3463334 RepID=UPI003A8ACCFB